MSDYFTEKAREWMRKQHPDYIVDREVTDYASFGRLCAVEGAGKMKEKLLAHYEIVDRAREIIGEIDPSSVVEELEKEGGR